MHNCKQEDNIGKLFDRLNEIKTAIAEIKGQSALTNQLLQGAKDCPGLAARVAKLEKDVGSLNITKAQFMAIGAFLGCLMSAIISILK